MRTLLNDPLLDIKHMVALSRYALPSPLLKMWPYDEQVLDCRINHGVLSILQTAASVPIIENVSIYDEQVLDCRINHGVLSILKISCYYLYLNALISLDI